MLVITLFLLGEIMDIIRDITQYNVIVHKYGPKIKLTEVDDDEEEIHYSEFFHSKKGIDISGNLIIELAVFDSVKEAQIWCNRENKFNETYNL